MRVFKLKDNSEISPIFRSKTTGTHFVLQLLADSQDRTVSDIRFSPIGCISIGNVSQHSNITFYNCEFNSVRFNNCKNITFDGCYFNNNCGFSKCSDITVRNSVGRVCIIDRCKITVQNCDDFDIYPDCGRYDALIDVTIIDCPCLDGISERIQNIRNVVEKEQREIDKIVSNPNIRGYKIVWTPNLVELSFPRGTEIVGALKVKSRASQAYVERIIPIKNFTEDGITNYSQIPCDYKLHQMVYPDKFNPTDDLCDSGIHFCKDVRNVKHWGRLSDNSYEAMLNILQNEQN